MNKKITATEIKKIIDSTLRGEYDSYHERSPSYSIQDKTDILGNMLDSRDTTNEEGKKIIMARIHLLIKDNKYDRNIVLNKINIYSQIPEVKKFLKSYCK